MLGAESTEIRVDILLVDDREDQLLTLHSVVETLGQNVVTARSGREALRALLKHDFAVIILDVNMPGLDGYETAALIRQRQSSEHTPIIFVSAGIGTEPHVSQGYSLGAVDYIQRPIVPDILRAKVAVFVELHKKREELRRLQEAEHRRRMEEAHLLFDEQARNLELEVERATRLRRLAGASIAMNSTVAVDEVLDSIAEQSRRVLDAARAEICLAVDSNWSKVVRAKSRAASCRDRDDLALEHTEIESWLRALDGPFRRAATHMASDPVWGATVSAEDRQLGIRNCIGAPLTGRQGGTVGYLVLCDRIDGDFTSDDEALLLQLAQMASLAVTNALYFEAREANRLKDEFLATLSHELRTPLTAILGWTWLLRSGNPDALARAEAMEIIERNARAQAKLIDDMLDISRIISGKIRLAQVPLHFQSQVEAAVDALRPAAHAKDLHLTLSIDTGLPPVKGDPDRLHQVVSNLLSNAIKFTPEGGQVAVRLEENGSKVRLSVQDSGIGIAPGFLPFVFERFLQAEGSGTRPQGGLGLGLAIVRHLVELHGGNVQAMSKGEGKGSTFIVELPGTPIAVGVEPHLPVLQTSAAGGAGEHASLAGLRILVVDDDADSRTTIAMVLRQSEAAVLEAASAAEGMALLDSADEANGLDVLVSDLAMPDEDGCSFIRRVRQADGRSPESFPAVAVSAFAREEDRSRALAAGFQLHLSKPIVPSQLLSAIAGLVAPRTNA